MVQAEISSLRLFRRNASSSATGFRGTTAAALVVGSAFTGARRVKSDPFPGNRRFVTNPSHPFGMSEARGTEGARLSQDPLHSTAAQQILSVDLVSSTQDGDDRFAPNFRPGNLGGTRNVPKTGFHDSVF